MWRHGVTLWAGRRFCPSDMMLPKELAGHASIRHRCAWVFPSGPSQDQTRGWVGVSAPCACGPLWFTGQILPLLRQIGGTLETGFDCGSERLQRLTSGVLLFNNHLSPKPHGNEFPQSSALIFLSGYGTVGGLHPLEPVPSPHKAKPI